MKEDFEREMQNKMDITVAWDLIENIFFCFLYGALNMKIRQK